MGGSGSGVAGRICLQGIVWRFRRTLLFLYHGMIDIYLYIMDMAESIVFRCITIHLYGYMNVEVEECLWEPLLDRWIINSFY